jgi:predicted phosphodiesterase
LLAKPFCYTNDARAKSRQEKKMSELYIDHGDDRVTLGIVSDLHLENTWMDVPCTGLDILVVAGDTHNKLSGVAHFVNTLLHNHPTLHIVLVAGNHEYYHKDIPSTERQLAKLRGERCHVLLNSSATVCGITFVGGTLWARPPQWARQPMEKLVKDFSIIQGLTARVVVDQCDECCSAIFDAADKHLMQQTPTGPLVVVTHFAPSLLSLHPKFGDDRMAVNRYFCSALDSVVLASGASLWVHGHTHESMDYTLGDTRVVCNPRGYSFEPNQHAENPRFVRPLVVRL